MKKNYSFGTLETFLAWDFKTGWYECHNNLVTKWKGCGEHTFFALGVGTRPAKGNEESPQVEATNFSCPQRLQITGLFALLLSTKDAKMINQRQEGAKYCPLWEVTQPQKSFTVELCLFTEKVIAQEKCWKLWIFGGHSVKEQSTSMNFSATYLKYGKVKHTSRGQELPDKIESRLCCWAAWNVQKIVTSLSGKQHIFCPYYIKSSHMLYAYTEDTKKSFRLMQVLLYS